MKKIYKTIVLLGTIATLGTSCNDWLNVYPSDQIKVRYIKLTIYEVPYQQKPCISGLRVFGTGDGEKPQNAEFTVARSENGLDMTVSAKAEQATGYNILWGHKKDKLYHSYLVYGEELKEKRIGALIKDKNYYVRVDTFNENGITEGNTVKMV